MHRTLMRASLLVASAAATARAQIRASELASISQTIDGTRIAMDYYRPRARGRDTLFGKSDMTWGATWTPGANWATTFDVSKPITLDGHRIAKGKYSLWFVLRDRENWTLFLDRKGHRFHEDRPDTSSAVVKFSVAATAAPFTEVLTWSFPEMRIDGATLVFQWERARVALDIKVDPSLVTTLSAADAAPYLGTYAFTELDSTGKAGKVSTLTISHEDGTLKGQWDPEDPYFKKFALIRIAPDWFAPGVYDKSGVIYEVLRPDLTFEFTRVRGKPQRFVMREEDDRIDGRGVRKP